MKVRQAPNDSPCCIRVKKILLEESFGLMYTIGLLNAHSHRNTAQACIYRVVVEMSAINIILYEEV